VTRAQLGDERSDGTLVAVPRLPGHLEECIGDAGHRGDDDDRRLRAAAPDDLDGMADSGGVG
jgi:hypothetical protein